MVCDGGPGVLGCVRVLRVSRLGMDEWGNDDGLRVDQHVVGLPPQELLLPASCPTRLALAGVGVVGDGLGLVVWGRGGTSLYEFVQFAQVDSD